MILNDGQPIKIRDQRGNFEYGTVSTLRGQVGHSGVALANYLEKNKACELAWGKRLDSNLESPSDFENLMKCKAYAKQVVEEEVVSIEGDDYVVKTYPERKDFVHFIPLAPR